MRFSDLSNIRSLAAVILAASVAFPAHAQTKCYVCDEVVQLDAKLAACFERDYEKYVTTASSSPSANTEVDLSSCAGSDGREIRGIDRMPSLADKLKSPRQASVSDLRSVYILDAQSVVCLKRLLDKNTASLDPSHSFDLVADCKQ